jgi:hypothetical protein
VDGESGRRGDHPQPGSNYFVRATDVNSNYNGLVVGLQRRFARGLAFTAGYTWGKSIDTASGLQGTNQPQDNYNMKAERGLSDFDVRQRFVLSGTWMLPFGAAQRWLNDGIGAKAFGGWQLAGIATLQSGQPMTALLSTALSGTQSNGTDRGPISSLIPTCPLASAIRATGSTHRRSSPHLSSRTPLAPTVSLEMKVATSSPGRAWLFGMPACNGRCD